MPGRKTDQKDSEWIAHLLQHELRDLTRYRVSLTQECNWFANRIKKVLAHANLKLASVARDPLAASGRAILIAILAGEEDAERLAEMSKGLLRKRIPELGLALEGRVTEHHRFLVKELLDHQEFVERKMSEVEAKIERRIRPFQAQVERLDTIPGVDRVSAWCLIAEVGVKMEQFPSAGHLAFWAGLRPGSFESAGKRLSGKTRIGSAALRHHLCQVGSVVSLMRDNYLTAQYRRLATRRGGKRATLALAHTVLVMAYHVLKRQQDHQELGEDYFDRLNAAVLRRSLVRRLERLGHKVILQPLPQPA